MAIHRRDIKDNMRWKDQYERAVEVPYISKGDMTLKVPLTVFCENRKRLVQGLRSEKPHGLVLIQAATTRGCLGKSTYVQDTAFFWAFGYPRSRVIGAIEVVSSKSYLIVPRIGIDGTEWCERQFNRSQIKEQYLVDGAWYLDELECFLELAKKNNDCREILILNYQKHELPNCVFKYEVDYHTLGKIAYELIAQKTESELKILRYIAKILESAVIHIMQRFRPGMTDNQLQAWFYFFMSYKSGFDQLTFTISSGSDNVNLNPNKRGLPPTRRQRVFKEGELCIIDMGAVYFGHKLSLGIVLPVGEKFNLYQRNAYDAMLRMRISICRELKAGMPLDLLQSTAEKSLISVLIDLRLLYGTVDGAFYSGVGKLLIPHNLVRSLDHLCEEPKELELGKAYLVQPGCYFTKSWLDKAYNHNVLKLYLTPELRKYENIVVRVSDPVVITTDGFRFLSPMPRALCTIIDMRLIDQEKRSDYTAELEKENLTVRSSLFRI